MKLPVPHAHLRKVLIEAGARRLAEEPLQRSELCTLETWMFPRKAARLLLIQHYPRTGRWEHFIQGIDGATGAAVEEILAVFGEEEERQPPPGDVGVSEKVWNITF